MLSLPPSVRIHLAAQPVDMRNYAQPEVMRSGSRHRLTGRRSQGPRLRIVASQITSSSASPAACPGH